jgi:Na+-transporting methylmalonyl-CoA/oxaloacetate decarboxylase gamma subunit
MTEGAFSRVGDESKESRPHRRFSALTALLFLLLLGAAVAGTGAAVSAFGEEGRARKAEQEAVEKERKAQDEAARFKGRFHQSEATWKAAIQEFRHAQAAAEDARRSEEATKAILDFFKKTLLSAGRPGDGSLPAAFWAGGQGSDVTLRKALDSTESQVAGAFADRPLAEAAIREMLGLGYLNVGEAAQAVRQSERALALREATQGAAHADAAACRNQLAIAYRLANRTTEAGRLFDREPDSAVHASALAARGSMLLLEKKPAEAELRLRECLTIRRKIQPGDWTTFDTESILGEALLVQKRFADAEPLLLSGYDGLRRRADAIPPGDQPRLTQAIERLVRLYEAWGKPDKATRRRDELRDAAAPRKS